jgi:hypothetical protein
VEFLKFLHLPRLTAIPLEAAISGPEIPRDLLVKSGWRLRNADDIAVTTDSYREYIYASKGEFSVMKHVFVATKCGLFADRPGYYLASGRPVVVQDTGFSEHLPCGQGLLAVGTVDEAAAALDKINSNYEHHSSCAHEIAVEYLDASKVLRAFLQELGI